MLDLLRGTPAGDALGLLSRQRFPRYPEDDRAFDLSCVSPPSEKPLETKGCPLPCPPPAYPPESDGPRVPDIEANVPAASPATTLCELPGDPVCLVDWYSADDSENPLNWSLRKKLWTSACISFATVAVYMGGATISAAYESFRAEFGVGRQVVTLGMSLYVFCYGVGALIFSPLSEIPQMGNPAYKTAGEIAIHGFSGGDLLYEALAMPFKITLLDPSTLFCYRYIGTDSFPHLSFSAPSLVACLAYTLDQQLYMLPLVERNGMPIVERRLTPALVSSVLGHGHGSLFSLAWTSFQDLHWIGPAMAAMKRNFAKWMPNHKPLWPCLGVTHLGEDDMKVEIAVAAHVPM
ncbi:hypothetical protein JCM10207_001598 [Rhodosporidiobolus poonsookiae]